MGIQGLCPKCGGSGKEPASTEPAELDCVECTWWDGETCQSKVTKAITRESCSAFQPKEQPAPAEPAREADAPVAEKSCETCGTTPRPCPLGSPASGCVDAGFRYWRSKRCGTCGSEEDCNRQGALCAEDKCLKWHPRPAPPAADAERECLHYYFDGMLAKWWCRIGGRPCVLESSPYYRKRCSTADIYARRVRLAAPEGECPHRDCFFRCLLSEGNGLMGCACDRDRETEQDCVLRDLAADNGRLERECAGWRVDRVALVKQIGELWERLVEQEAATDRAWNACGVEHKRAEQAEARESAVSRKCWELRGRAENAEVQARELRVTLRSKEESVKAAWDMKDEAEARAQAAEKVARGSFLVPDDPAFRDLKRVDYALRFTSDFIATHYDEIGACDFPPPHRLCRLLADAIAHGVGEGVFVTPDKLPALRRTANTAACLEGSDDETVEAIRQVHGIADELEKLAPAEAGEGGET